MSAARCLPVALAATVAACSWIAPDGPPLLCHLEGADDEARLPAGPHPEGGHVLPDARRVTPWGDQVALGTFPLGLLPLGERYVAVTDAGSGDQRLRILDLVTRQVTATDTLAPADGAFFYGLAFDGRRLWASGGGGAQGNTDGTSAVHVYELDPETGRLGARREIPMDGYPAGLALSADGATLVVARHRGDGVTLVDTASETATRTVAFATTGRSFPYAVATARPDRGRDEAYVALAGDSRIAIVDLPTGDVDYVQVGKGPAGLAAAPGGRLFVANADSDSLSVVDLERRQVVQTQPLGDAPDGPRGLSPTALALTPDGGRLLVTLSGENAVDVLDATTLERVGRVPAGWYPTAALWHPHRDELLILNGKGVGAAALVGGDAPASGEPQGTLSIVPAVDGLGLLEGALAVAANTFRPRNVTPRLACVGEPGRFPLPAAANGPTPIEHVVLIVREGRSFDAVLGDLEGADGDPARVRWGERVTPNLHALARQFTVLDNFYAEAQSTPQARQWTTSDVSNDFSEKSWAAIRARANRPLADLASSAASPEGGHVWQRLAAAGVDYVDFGEPTGVDDRTAIQPGFPGGQNALEVLDSFKAAHVADAIRREGLPRFTYLLLPGDHALGASPGASALESMVAESDAATGIVVQALSRSPLWSRSVVFVVDAGAVDGADHVDPRRVPCLVIGPWARHGHVSHLHYAYPSLWRTITLLLGTPPLSRHDATAARMLDVFATRPDPTPYEALPMRVPLEAGL